MWRNLVIAVAVVGGLGLMVPARAEAQTKYKYRVFYQSRYNNEIRKSRNDYDTRQQADAVAADLRTVHAVARAWVEMVNVGSSDNSSSSSRPRAEPQYRVGEYVYAWWGNKWWDARILQVSGNSYYITYPGWGSEWNEWVGPSRLSR